MLIPAEMDNAVNAVVLRETLMQELNAILQYWAENTVDEERGGFVGEIGMDNRVKPGAEKGLVLNSRILWSFSAAAIAYPDKEWEKMAHRAYHYICDHFIDPVYGGAYWSLHANGKKHNGKKQVYGIAFCIYGLSEYVKLTGSREALQLAKRLFFTLEKYAVDKTGEGYMEAFQKNWQPIADLRLSAKDENAPKTTNTHLHVVEAYANLYEVWPDEMLAQSIKSLLEIFDQKIIDKETCHLRLFFDRDWSSVADAYSFGHDIEAAWLLQHCASVLNDKEMEGLFKQWAVALSRAALQWIDADGALNYEMNAGSRTVNKEKHWWVQAEAMVGFYNAYQLTGDSIYMDTVTCLWEFIKKYIKDPVHGEWYWGVKEDYQLMQEPKAGFWKCPYHNTRACLELIKRIAADIKE